MMSLEVVNERRWNEPRTKKEFGVGMGARVAYAEI